MSGVEVFYLKNRKLYSYWATGAEADEVLAQRAKTAKMLRRLDKELKEDWLNEHRGGYCSTCNILLPKCGTCDLCGGN